MKYFLIILAVAVASVCGYWFFVSKEQMADVVTPTSTHDASTTTVDTTMSQASSSNHTQTTGNFKTYENKTWGILFDYPNGWVVLESTFRAASSLFNVVVQPMGNNHLPDPIIITVTNASWGHKLFERAKENDGFSEVSVATYAGVSYNSTDMGLPTQVLLFQVSPDLWITIISKKGYENELNQVLESLVITPVDIGSM